MVNIGSDLLNNDTENRNLVQNDGSEEFPGSNLEDEDWVVAISQSLQKEKENNEESANELDQTGTLIVPPRGEDDNTSGVREESKSPSLKSEDDSGNKVTIASSHGGLDLNIPDDASIPSDLESLPDPALHLPMVRKSSKDPEELLEGKKEDELTDREDQSLIQESESQSERVLAAELARTDEMFYEMFSKTDYLINLPKWGCVAIGLAAMIVVVGLVVGLVVLVMDNNAKNMLLQERVAWEASRDDRFYRLLSEKNSKMESMEFDMAVLREKIKKLEEEQQNHQEMTEHKPISPPAERPLSPPYASPKSFRTSEFFYKFPFGASTGSSSKEKNNFSDYDFERSWHQAEAKLEEVAHEATKAVQSGLSTFKRSVSHYRENVFDKVTDFRKRVHTAVTKGAERFAMEAEQWSAKYENDTLFRRQQYRQPRGRGTVNGTKDTTNFKAVATTLISGVAFAAAATYLTGALEENE